MKASLLLAALTVATLAGSATARTTAPQVQLDLQMTDGSRLIGVLDQQNLELNAHTNIGVVTISIATCQKFEVVDQGTSMIVHWANGDRLTTKPNADALLVETILGKVSVPLATLNGGSIKLLPIAKPLKPVKVEVSGSYGHARSGEWGNHQVAYTHDGKEGTSWSSGDWKGWIEFDLGEITRLDRIEAHLQFAPAGQASHEIHISDHPIGSERDGARLLQEFDGQRKDGDILEVTCPPDTSARYVRVRCLSSRAWFNLRELAIFPDVPRA